MPDDQDRISHDWIYKRIFSFSFAIRHLIRFIASRIDVDEDWLAQFDFSTLEPVSTEHIAPNLRIHQNDVVWRLRLREGGEEHWTYLLVMIEFQSDVDYTMALRIRTCVDLLYHDIIRSRRERDRPRRFRAADRLPPVWPVVLYNGKSR